MLSRLRSWVNFHFQDARGDQCDKCGRLINATELKVPKNTHTHTVVQCEPLYIYVYSICAVTSL